VTRRFRLLSEKESGTMKTVVIVTHNNELAGKAELLFEIRDGMLKV